MKIAVLYICTGKYAQFWSDFYKSSEQYFLNNKDKHYFVFTDNSEITSSSNITKIEKQYEGFPLDSLFRYKNFLNIEKQLFEFDYIFFFNSNMLFVDYVDDEIIPNKEDGGLVALIAPSGYSSNCRYYPYERNKKSKAYIPYIKGIKYNYYMGSFNGGKTIDYLKLIQACYENILHDYNHNFIAVFHDESHLNQYLYNKSVKKLSPVYGYPEGWKLPYKPKIIIRDKVVIDPFFKKHSLNLLVRIKNKIHRWYKAITW